jgi:PKD repeat protein
LAALAAIAIMACGSDVAFATPSDTILTATIYKPGAQPTTESITSGSLESRPGQCPVYGKPGMQEYGLGGRPESQQFGATTWTLGAILACLQPAVQPGDATGGVTVFKEDGSPESGPNSTLSSGDLVPPTSFNDPSESPVVTDLGSSMRYDRPWRGGNDEDFLDQVTESAPIAIAVFEGNRIPVTVSASPTTLSEGGTVSFNASATGTGLSYQWSFGGGAPSSTQQNPDVTFNSAGVWTVSLLVTDANGDDGHAQLTVTVNAASQTTSTPTTPGTVTTGPSNSSGTTPNGAPGTTPGQNRSPTGKPQHQPTGTNPQSPKTGTKKHKTTTTQTSTTPTTPSTGGNGGSGSSGNGGSGSSGGGASASGSGSSGAGASTTPRSSSNAAPHQQPHPPRPAPALPGAPQVVRGQLISDVVPVPETTSPFVHVIAAAPATAPALHPPARASVLPIIGSALAVLVLLGAGAGRELRGRWRWRWPRLRPGV